MCPLYVLCSFILVTGMHHWCRGDWKCTEGMHRAYVRSIHFLRLKPHHLITRARFTGCWPEHTHTHITCSYFKKKYSFTWWVLLKVPIIFQDKAVHIVSTPTSFGTQGSSILDIAISPYSIYLFQYLFSIFYSTGEPATGYKPGVVSTTSTGLQL